MTRHILPELLGHQPPRQEWESRPLSPGAVVKRIDGTLRNLHQYGFAMQKSLDSIPDYTEEIARLRSVIDQTLTDSPEVKPHSRFYFDLLNRAAFLEEMAYAPLLLNATEAADDRIEKLIDGVYGLNVHVLADALEYYDDPTHTEAQRDDHRGIIHELTAVALLNRNQAFGCLALPSTLIADTRSKTDIFYFHRQDNTPLVTNVQVKSKPRHYMQRYTPNNGIIVTAGTMNNTDLATSRAIVAELYADPTVYQEPSPDRLNKSHAHFMNIVEQKIASKAAFYPPHDVVHVGLRN